MSEIYVVVIHENTGIAKLARVVQQYQYSHIAICLDEHLSDFMSFSRRRYHVPFDSGFMRETRNCFGDMRSSQFKAKVFRIEITDDELARITKLIREIEGDPEYLFNIFSMITLPLIHGFDLPKTHTCISFTARVLQEVASLHLTKPCYKYSIQDIDELLTSHTHFEGLIDKDDNHVAGYMDTPGMLTNIFSGAKVIGKLLVRVFTRRA